jgi:hypothetical protein
MKYIFIVITSLLMMGCQDNTPKPPQPETIPRFNYDIVLTGMSDGKTDGRRIIELQADVCVSELIAEAFDGRKTPLLSVECYYAKDYRWAYDSSLGYSVWRPIVTELVFKGLADAVVKGKRVNVRNDEN